MRRSSGKGLALPKAMVFIRTVWNDLGAVCGLPLPVSLGARITVQVATTATNTEPAQVRGDCGGGESADLLSRFLDVDLLS